VAVPVTQDVAGKVVAVVDEIADTGETLALVADAVRANGAARRGDSVPGPSLVGQSAPGCLRARERCAGHFPWDRRVLIAGQWQPHPEIVAALKAQTQEPV